MIAQMNAKVASPEGFVNALTEKARRMRFPKRNLVENAYAFLEYLKGKVNETLVISSNDKSQLGHWVPTPPVVVTVALRSMVIKEKRQNPQTLIDQNCCQFCGDKELACVVCSPYRCCFFKACGGEGDADIQCNLCESAFHKNCLQEHLGPQPLSHPHVFWCGNCQSFVSTTVDQENSTTVDQENSTTVDQENSTTVDQENSATVDQENSTTVDRDCETDAETIGKCEMSKIKHYHM
jgi:hypothetical protein